MVSQWVVLNDIHFKHESKAYYEALKLSGKMPNLKGIILNGDVAEIESVSRHPKSPKAAQLLIDEIDYLNQKLDTLQRLFPGLPVEYICGNHEHRVYRFIRDVAPQMWGMAQFPKLLRFDERKNFRFHDYTTNQLIKVGKTRDLYARHEPLAGGQMHAKGTAEKATVSIIYGHTHVRQQFTHKKFGPKPYTVTAYSNGWLGDIKNSCFDYRGPRDNWQLGFSRIDCEEKNGDYEVRFIELAG